MSQQTPEQPAPTGQAAPTPPPATAPETGKQPPWGDAANFNAEEAWKTIQNLRKEKGSPDPQLRSELTALQEQQAEQQRRLAEVFGVKPEQVSDTEKLAETVSALQQQIVGSERRALAAEFKVPESLLTATTAQAMRDQAAALVEFATGAHVAASTAAATPPAPAFQANPGQGQAGNPTEPGFEQYYDPATGRPRF